MGTRIQALKNHQLNSTKRDALHLQQYYLSIGAGVHASGLLLMQQTRENVPANGVGKDLPQHSAGSDEVSMWLL